MKKPKIEKMTFCGVPCLLVNDRYQIYLDNGVVYDTIYAKDIPKYVFKIRDKALKRSDNNAE